MTGKHALEMSPERGTRRDGRQLQGGCSRLLEETTA